MLASCCAYAAIQLDNITSASLRWCNPLQVALLMMHLVAQAGSAPTSACPPYLSNYTSGVANLSIYTSFLQTYEQAGLDTDPSTGFAAFAPTDAAWNRIEQILSENSASACAFSVDSVRQLQVQRAEQMVQHAARHMCGKDRRPDTTL